MDDFKGVFVLGNHKATVRLGGSNTPLDKEDVVLSTEVYNPKSNRWLPGPPLAHSLRTYMAFDRETVCCHNGKISILRADCVDQLDPASELWNRLPLSHGAHWCSRQHAVLDSKVFRQADYEVLQSIDLATLLPTDVSSLPLKSGMKAAMASDPGSKRIYLAGGWDLATGAIPALIRYDINTNQWDCNLPPMETARAGAAAAWLNGKLYVVGGSSQECFQVGNWLRSVEIYDPVTNKWSVGPPMLHAHAQHYVFPLYGKLYVFASEARMRSANKCEVLDVQSGQWTEFPSPETTRGYPVYCQLR